MFGIGFGELILLLVIALIVFGPEKLPEVAETLGKFYRQVKDYTDSLRETVERELSIEDLKKINNIPDEVSQLVLPEEEVERKEKEIIKELGKKQWEEAGEDNKSQMSEKLNAEEKQEQYNVREND